MFYLNREGECSVLNGEKVENNGGNQTIWSGQEGGGWKKSVLGEPSTPEAGKGKLHMGIGEYLKRRFFT